MAVTRGPRWRPLLSVAILGAIAGPVVAKKVAQLSVPEIEDALQVGISYNWAHTASGGQGFELHRLTIQRDVQSFES